MATKRRTTKKHTTKRKKPARKKKWMQKASASIKRRGTKGVFRAWCLRRGYKSVTAGCIAEGKRSKNPTIRRRAALAGTFRKASRSRKRRK